MVHFNGRWQKIKQLTHTYIGMQLRGTVITDCFYNCEMQLSMENIEKDRIGPSLVFFLAGTFCIHWPGAKHNWRHNYELLLLYIRFTETLVQSSKFRFISVMKAVSLELGKSCIIISTPLQPNPARFKIPPPRTFVVVVVEYTHFRSPPSPKKNPTTTPQQQKQNKTSTTLRSTYKLRI